MFSTVWPGLVSAWPTGIDTDRWSLSMRANKDVDVLIYDKIVWHRRRYLRTIVEPLIAELRRRNLSFHVLRYGSYREEQLHKLSRRAVRWSTSAITRRRASLRSRCYRLASRSLPGIMVAYGRSYLCTPSSPLFTCDIGALLG
jgi:hypothetical protein